MGSIGGPGLWLVPYLLALLSWRKELNNEVLSAIRPMYGNEVFEARKRARNFPPFDI